MYKMDIRYSEGRKVFNVSAVHTQGRNGSRTPSDVSTPRSHSVSLTRASRSFGTPMGERRVVTVDSTGFYGVSIDRSEKDRNK